MEIIQLYSQDLPQGYPKEMGHGLQMTYIIDGSKQTKFP
jgi:hypothetical protein